jgi:hypothetical protein
VKKLSKKRFVVIAAAVCLLIYGIGVVTNLFGSAVFSMFFVVSREVALDIAYLAVMAAVALITLTLVMSPFKKPSAPAQVGTVDQSSDKANGMVEDQESLSEKNEKAALRGSELSKVISASMRMVDLSFDVLIGLQEKRINWQQFESSDGFGENMNFTGQSIPPLNLDFSKFSSAIRKQIPKETAKEAYNILQAVYSYFSALSLDDEIEASIPNFQDAKAMISAYFMLNDLWLGKVAGDNENKKEKGQLETVLKNLAEKSNFKVNVEELWSCLDKTSLESETASAIEDSRAIFKEQLKLLQTPVNTPQVGQIQ